MAEAVTPPDCLLFTFTCGHLAGSRDTGGASSLVFCRDGQVKARRPLAVPSPSSLLNPFSLSGEDMLEVIS